ncbi:ATP-binding cassette sub-family E member 1, partial [Orchesella cincta]
MAGKDIACRGFNQTQERKSIRYREELRLCRAATASQVLVYEMMKQRFKCATADDRSFSPSLNSSNRACPIEWKLKEEMWSYNSTRIYLDINSMNESYQNTIVKCSNFPSVFEVKIRVKERISKCQEPRPRRRFKISKLVLLSSTPISASRRGVDKNVKKSCPVVRMGKLCIEVVSTDKISKISEELCIGCGICVKQSGEGHDAQIRPKLVQAPSFTDPPAGGGAGARGDEWNWEDHGLEDSLGEAETQLGKFTHPPDWTDILTYFRGSELQNYFIRFLEDELKALIKPQYVDQIPKAVKGTEADVIMFDEPSSYLDVKQRINAAQTIRSLLAPDRFVIVVEHDLSVLDYLSDFICVLYGVPGAYGVVTMPFLFGRCINIFLDGFVPTENLRFREESLIFKVSETATEEEVKRMARYEYPTMTKTMGSFRLDVTVGQFTDSEILVLLGENGTGKTTFIRMLAGKLQPDEVLVSDIPLLNVSYKPQKISPKSTGTVRQLLHEKIRDAYIHPQ